MRAGRVPRRTSRLCARPPSLSAFFRAVGLDSLNSLWARLRGYAAEPEPKKYVQRKSFFVAFQRCGVHLMPSIVSIIIIAINLKGYFIGAELAGISGQTSQDIAGLQVAAKVQELLIVASLAAVVVHRVRHDLISGEGVPFGLISTGSLFSQLSFFWSPGFIGPVSSKAKLNASLLIIAVISGLIAVTAGPAVAVLLIPRVQTWSAGGTWFWINGTAENFWPSRVDLEHYMPELGHVSNYSVSCTSPDAYANALCPSGGFLSLLNHLGSWLPISNEWPAHAGSSIPIESPRGQMERYSLIPATGGGLALETAAFAAPGPAAWVAARLGSDWNNAIQGSPMDGSQISRYRYYQTMSSTVKTQIPAVRVLCSPPVALNQMQQGLAFPWAPEFEPATELPSRCDWGALAQIRHFQNVTFTDGSLDNRTPSGYPKIFDIDISNLPGNTATIGLIFEAPWVSQSRNVSGCVVDARWAQGSVSVEYANYVLPAIDGTPQRASCDPYLSNDVFFPKPKSWRRLNITNEWFHAVNFKLPDKIRSLNPPNTTAIEALIMADSGVKSDYDVTIVERALATYFADALARVSSWRTVNIAQPLTDHAILPVNFNYLDNHESSILKGEEAFKRPDLPDDMLTRFDMNQTITGYAYLASATTDYLSLAVLFFHLIIALGHTVLLLATKKSSGCWDTLPELLAVAQQSVPSKTALVNTAAGIKRLRTFRQRARMRVAQDDAEHVGIWFDADRQGGDLPRIDSSRKYG